MIRKSKERISNYPQAMCGRGWPIFKSYCMIEGSLLRVSPEAWPREVKDFFGLGKPAVICSQFVKLSSQRMHNISSSVWNCRENFLTWCRNTLHESKRKRRDYAYDAMITLGIDNCPRSGSHQAVSVISCLRGSLLLSLSLPLSLFEAKWALA